MKKILCIYIVLTLCFSISGCSSAKKSESEGTTTTEALTEAGSTEKKMISVTLSVNCRTAVDAKNETAMEIAPDGNLLAKTSFETAEGDTILDLLKKTDLVLDISQSSYGSYVAGIQSLGQGDAGTMSGWLYFVNGESPQVAASAYILADGDQVEFVYTCDGGNDVGR